MPGPPLDPDRLDRVRPFELDRANLPHLFKHGGLSEEDLWDVWNSDPVFLAPANDAGDADWLMVAEVPGGHTLMVPLAKPKSGDQSKARPIGLYRVTSAVLLSRYREER